ncbi:hypothetical protein E3N88_05915 [Mikania micrantha]|uniref:Chromo domain-containing protein n=1 Tax=Mikania micrantha TaxID=192012 RepID=A0A5N6PQ85_9ASTR|nr:hypothetical protein E3N88_05915 [Mikania micrantha]
MGKTTVDYLGHIISSQGVSMDPVKIQAVLDWPIPTSIKGLRGFMGLTGYYGKLIQSYGSIARPLTDLTKKNAFIWSKQAHEAFTQLKHALVFAPVLTLSNFNHPFIIESDASGRGIGAVLMQHKKPIAFFSKGLSDRNLAKSAYDQEMMALVLAVQHWHQYLLGTRFVVYTDQKSLKFLLQQRVTTPDQQNWVAKLLGYDFEIQYKPGRSNRAADALSRQAEYGAINTIYLGPLWVTYRRLAANLYWSGMTSAVKQYVRECEVCQRCKASTLMPGGLLQPLDIPEAIWEDLSMDFIGGLPTSKGFNVILVVVGRLSKYAHFITLKHPYTAKGVADLFVKEVVRHHGIPKTIVRHNLKMSSTYHPETDGQTEVVNRCLEAYLRCFAVDKPKTWAQWLPWAEFWYNSTFHSSSGMSHFELVYGRKPPTIFHYGRGEIKVESVAQEFKDRDHALQLLKRNLATTQSAIKAAVDKHRRELNFLMGEWVYVKLQPYRQLSVVNRKNHKLAPRFFGPFQVLEKIGKVAYKLLLPATSKVHPVFHVSLLKKAIRGESTTVFPADLEMDVSDLLTPATILDSRSRQEGTREVTQWLVQWKDQSREEATWEDKEWVLDQFPNVSLEHKTLKDGAGNDKNNTREEPPKPPILHVYFRRGKIGISH